MKLSEFDFELPEELIAQTPLDNAILKIDDLESRKTNNRT